MVARVALGVLALVVLAWLAVGLRNARSEAEAVRLIGTSVRTVPLEQLDRAGDDYRSADRLNASSDPDLHLAALENFTGHPRRAIRLLREVTRREPENFDAWFLMAGVAAKRDPSLAARAEARARELNPLQYRRRG
ncbi:MAG: hypothetical protein QOI32_264 [Thermoleophilaceae bacterium]|nr:hypothetical protein [Thermoleophilaceae bacterium]